MKEVEIEYAILGLLNANNIAAWKVDVKGFYNTRKGIWQKSNNIYAIRGQADISCILPDGRYCAIEVKTPTGRVSEEQYLFNEMVRRHNGFAFVVRSVEDAIEYLANSGYPLKNIPQ